MAGAQFLFAPYTVEVNGFDPEIDAWVVSQWQRSLAVFYAIVVAILGSYWLLTAIAGRDHFLGSQSANVALILSYLAFALGMAVASFVQVPEDFRGACPLLGVSDSFPPLPDGVFGFDLETPCQEFIRGVTAAVSLGLPIILLLASAALRIVYSRRQP
ncbi:hypothetical protein GCM10009127_27080 [Alteraurantiacibacter aestuarii]